MNNLEGKVALVTGASRGIGAAVAEQLGAAGAVVVGTATSQAGADRITERLASQGVTGEGMVLNVTDAESVASVLADMKARHGLPAILVNNAGITKDNLLMRMNDEEWFDVINTNLSAVYRLSKAVLRGMMKARWGRIINISSVVG
ncbi:SDR family NAD(P)-dependent oxidoreductase, partial [Marinimicrobium sp. UBA4509]